MVHQLAVVKRCSEKKKRKQEVKQVWVSGQTQIKKGFLLF